METRKHRKASPIVNGDYERGADNVSPHQRRTGHISWKRNLFVIWFAQCITMMGFSFVFPFIPLFVRELGIQDPAQAALWAGISGSGMGVTMIFFGPIWGILGDRYGRKRNMVRAMCGGAIVMALTGISGNVYQLTAIRALTGVASGIMATAMALVASTMPKDRIAFGMGVLQSAMFVGNTVGPLVGGYLAEAIGFRATFFVTGGIGILAAVMVLVLVREDFQRPTEPGPVFRLEAFSSIWRFVASREVAPLLATVLIVQIAPVMMFVVLPLLLDGISPGSGTSATGIAFAILGVTGALASYVTGWLSLRVRLTRMLATACVGAGLFYLPFLVINSLPLVYVFLALGGIFQGALLGSISGLLGLAVPEEKRGAGFGAIQSVMSTAFGFGPLLGGAIATVAGLRSVFLVQAFALLASSVLVVKVLSGREAERRLILQDQPAEITPKPVSRPG